MLKILFNNNSAKLFSNKVLNLICHHIYLLINAILQYLKAYAIYSHLTIALLPWNHASHKLDSLVHCRLYVQYPQTRTHTILHDNHSRFRLNQIKHRHLEHKTEDLATLINIIMQCKVNFCL